MLNALRIWGKRVFSSSTHPTVEQARNTGQKARDDRASTVSKIRDEIYRIQHEISDLNDAMQAGGASDASARANDARMASLHQELARKQQDLAKYQARI